MDGSPPASSVRGILQAGTLEWEPFPSPGDLSNPEVEPGAKKEMEKEDKETDGNTEEVLGLEESGGRRFT